MSATANKTNGRTRTPRVVVATTEPGGLAQALLDLQADAPKLQHNAEGQIQNRTYAYTTLDGILDDVVPLLVKGELLWSAKVILEDGASVMRYRMTHVPSGEADEWTGPLPCVGPGPQNLGSAITYMRRYTLLAYLNLAPGEDDDGAGASQPPPAEPASQPTAAEPGGSERPASAKQRNLLRAKARTAQLTDGQFANALKAAWGDAPATWSDEEAAKRFLDRALNRLPARLVDAAIAQINEAPR